MSDRATCGSAGPADEAPPAPRPARTGRALPWVTAGLLALAIVGAAVRGPLEAEPRWTGSDGEENPTSLSTVQLTFPPQDPSDQPTLPPFEPFEVPAVVGQVLMWVAIAAAALVLALVLRRLLSQLQREPAIEGPDVAGGVSVVQDAVPDLTDAFAEAQARLRERSAPRDAVIAAWVALEEAAADHGIVRAASQTPTEFAVGVLRRGADAEAVTHLRDVYLAARFSEHPVTHDDVARAQVALDAIARAWQDAR